jgi:hypothetical protein
MSAPDRKHPVSARVRAMRLIIIGSVFGIFVLLVYFAWTMSVSFSDPEA